MHQHLAGLLPGPSSVLVRFYYGFCAPRDCTPEKVQPGTAFLDALFGTGAIYALTIRAVASPEGIDVLVQEVLPWQELRLDLAVLGNARTATSTLFATLAAHPAVLRAIFTLGHF